jgi:hypothetical protein
MLKVFLQVVLISCVGNHTNLGNNKNREEYRYNSTIELCNIHRFHTKLIICSSQIKKLHI